MPTQLLDRLLVLATLAVWGVLVALTLAIGPALGQTVGTVTTTVSGCTDPANCAADEALSWVCSNKSLVAWVGGILLAHLGFSSISTVLKKAGVNETNPIVKLVRVAALDALSNAEKEAQADPKPEPKP